MRHVRISRVVPPSVVNDPEFCALSWKTQAVFYSLKLSPAAFINYDRATFQELSGLNIADDDLDVAVDELRRSKFRSALTARTRRRYIRAGARRGVYERDGYQCVTCSSKEHLSLDHVVPFSAGGLDVLENLQTLCRSCNSRKGARVQ